MKSGKASTILLTVLLILSLAGNVFLFYQYEQQKNEIFEYRLQIAQLANVIEQFENENAGSKTYDALSAWWDTAKNSFSDILDYGTGLQEEYNEQFDKGGK